MEKPIYNFLKNSLLKEGIKECKNQQQPTLLKYKIVQIQHVTDS